ncbi:hypothetical protein A1O1_06462 [Capronia coronata CBS 617.96]|uniref:Uncharacterized protein n=1 Tax=Capronia coronata CBS 617.96 TaxID=1182541 RepID=W9Y0S8_9EURO|nr:uncharacterized protein A1O1_06462 [Capronia coronata CBS 617.96]EXJ86093.1 hypothetical protein A1O1_06462 [Capronia coronata CBS 617.96]
MLPWEKLIKLVGGRALAERSEQKRLEREYKDAAAALKLITEVANEPRIEYTSRPPSVQSTSIPKRRKPVHGTFGPPHRPVYERCASSPVVPAFNAQKTPPGPPDITARDLSAEELKRNYSSDNVWHFHHQPLPPMPQMTGFGRYRRAINAPAQWQMDHLHQNMHDMGTVIVNHLGDCPPAGLDVETWREYRTQHSRTSSLGSSRSSSSGPGQTVATEYLDTTTGTRVSRGFCPSNTSSAASSFRDGSGNYRRDSNMSKASMTSPISDADPEQHPRQSRVSPYRHTSVTSISPLTAISETQEAYNTATRKVEKPCEFDQGDNNENAVASDEDDDLDWSDMLVVGGGNASNLTKRLERTSSTVNTRLVLTKQRTNSQERPKSRTSKRAVPDRSKTIKAATRPAQRRVQLQRKQSDSIDLVPATSFQPAQKESKRQTHRSRAAVVVKPQSENDDLLVRKQAPKEGVTQQKTIAYIERDQHDSTTASPSPVTDFGAVLLQSDTSNETLFTGHARNTMQSPSRGKRDRSNTVCRIPLLRSSSPIVQAEDSTTMKK